MSISRNSNLLISIVSICVLAQGVATAATVKWKEDANGVQLNTVCYNHKYGSIVYRQCRADAQKQFKGRCSHFERKLEFASGEQRAILKKGEKKYCYAARHLRIVN